MGELTLSRGGQLIINKINRQTSLFDTDSCYMTFFNLKCARAASVQSLWRRPHKSLMFYLMSPRLVTPSILTP